MTTAERLVRSWMVSEKDSEVDESIAGTSVVAQRQHQSLTYSSGISSGQFTLLDIIKALRDFLTSEEDDLRAKGEFVSHPLVHITSVSEGVEFLSSVLGRCPREKLNRQASK